jgi:hypothetical protein
MPFFYLADGGDLRLSRLLQKKAGQKCGKAHN